MLTLPIAAVHAATPRSRRIFLDARGVDFSFRAGQAILVGTHGQAIRRPYSIACAPDDTAREHTIELLVGVKPDGSAGPHLERFEPGVRVDVEGPVGRFLFPERHDARHFLFIAGGSGIAPLRSMMRQAFARTPERPTPPNIGLVYTARTADDFAYADEFEQLASEGALALMLTVTRASDQTPWAGARGRINLTHLRQMVPHTDTLCFVCGPQALVADIIPMLREIGVSDGRIRIEEW